MYENACVILAPHSDWAMFIYIGTIFAALAVWLEPVHLHMENSCGNAKIEGKSASVIGLNSIFAYAYMSYPEICSRPCSVIIGTVNLLFCGAFYYYFEFPEFLLIIVKSFTTVYPKYT